MFEALTEVLDLNESVLSIKDLKEKLNEKKKDLPIILSNGTFLTLGFIDNKEKDNSFILTTVENKTFITVQDLIDLLTLIPNKPIESFPYFSLVNVDENASIYLENNTFISDVLELNNHLFLMVKKGDI